MTSPTDTQVAAAPWAAESRAPENWPAEAQAMWNCSMEALVVVDDGRCYLRANDRAATMLAAPVSKILRRRLEDFTPREQWPRLMALWRQFEREGRIGGEYEVLQDDGSRLVVEFRGVRNIRPGEHLIVVREVAPRWALKRFGVGAGGKTATLTRRETEILQLAAEGRLGPEIARLLCISPSTVKTHLERIYQKLGARDRASAVAIALRRQIIT